MEDLPVPSDRSEFATFSDNGVKVAECEENGFEFVLFAAPFHRVLIEIVQCFVNVRIHS